MRTPDPLPEPFRSRPFPVAEARAAGISASRLRAKDLTMPHRGARVHAAPRTLDERILALETVLGDATFFSHATAAMIYGLPLPLAVQRTSALHVSVAAPAFPPRISGVIGHRLSSKTGSRRYGNHHVIEPIAAWVQLAGILSLTDLIVAGDALVRRKYPVATMDQLAAVLRSLRGSRGSLRACAAHEQIRAGTDSPRESVLRLIIVAAGLPEPVIHHAIIDADGYFVATPDLAYVAEKIAIEYDGSIHQADARVYADDIPRREAMEEAGWLVITVVKGHIHSRQEWLVARIARALHERQPRVVARELVVVAASGARNPQ